MGKAKRGLRQGPSQPRKAVKGVELVKRVNEALSGMEQKLLGFVQGFQQNLNQLYRNEKAIGDMAYTNNVHVTVLREALFEKGILTKEEYEERVKKELVTRDAIQKKQAEEARQRAEELRKKQAEEASAKMAESSPALQEEPAEPIIFGGDLGTENSDGEAEEREQGHVEDQVPALQE